jgi:hypothetical protein
MNANRLKSQQISPAGDAIHRRIVQREAIIVTMMP